MKPPYNITPKIMALVAAISEKLGEVKDAHLSHFKSISPATTSRDLKWAVDKSILTKQGDKRITEYKFT